MTWSAIAVPQEEITAEMLFELSKKHRLVQEDAELAVDRLVAISPGCIVFEIKDEEERVIATAIISDIRDGESADVDLVPVTKYFSPVGKDGQPNGTQCNELVRDALQPIFLRLLEGRGLRRLTAMIPKSRSRTFKALRECGFRKEGVMRDAIQLKGQGPEDVVIMGMLAPKE